MELFKLSGKWQLSPMSSRRKPTPLLLVTAFEPFGGFSSNPSMEVMAALRSPPAFRLVRATLPVDFVRVAEAVPRIFDRANPSAILCLGLAADSPALRLERLANPDWCEPGASPASARRLDGPGLRCTSLDLDTMAMRLCRAGFPAMVSQDAGRYLCNFVYYLTLGWAAERNVPALFVHLPATPRLAAEHVIKTGRALPSMDPGHMARAVQILAAQISSSKNRHRKNFSPL